MSKEAGYAWVSVFVLLANSSAVAFSWLFQTIELAHYILYGFLFVVLFFSIICSTKGFTAPRISRQGLMAIIAINITTAVNWGCYLFALKFIEPAAVTAIICGVGPMSIAAYNRIAKSQPTTTITLLTCFGILLGAIILAWGSFSGRSGLDHLMASEVITGVMAATLGGTMQSATILSVQKLSQEGWNSTQIMSFRFALLLIAALAYITYSPQVDFNISFSSILQIFVLAAIGICIPLWALQIGLSKANATISSAIIAVGPVVTYVAQLLDSRISTSLVTALGCIVIVSATCLAVISDIKDRASRASIT